MGYTPLFDTMLTGTLYGRWPHTGIWACLLSRASREGVIDEQPAALAAAIGVPVELLLDCIRDFMSPDPESRTPDNDGRRLELLQQHRSWGWRVVNHYKYREKARKKVYDDERTESGEDAARKQAERAAAAASRAVPRCPDTSRAVPLSEAEATPEAEAKKKPRRAHARDDSPDAKTRGEADPPPGLDPAAWSRWCDYRKQIRKPLKPVSIPAAQRELAAFGSDQADVVEQSVAQGWQGLFALKARPKAAETIGGRRWE